MTTQDQSRGLFRRWSFLLLPLLFLAVNQSQGAWYAKFDGIDGDVQEGPLENWTRIHDVGAIVTNGVASPVQLSCTVRKGFDRTSPVLLQRLGDGELIPRASFLYIPTHSSNRLYRVTLTEVLVAVMKPDSGADGMPPGEELSLNFTKLEFAELDRGDQGEVIGGLTARFDGSTGEGDLKARSLFRAEVTYQGDRMGVMVTWPGERGHTYRILSRPTLTAPWAKRMELTVPDDGPASQFVATEVPSLFMRVEEVD